MCMHVYTNADLIVPGMNVFANLEQPEPIEEARVPMIPRVVMMWFLLDSDRHAFRGYPLFNTIGVMAVV